MGPAALADATRVVFRLTSNNLSEGGRNRTSEAYFNIDRAKAEFFGGREIVVRTDDGEEFPARLSGNSGRGTQSSPKNLRSSPSRKFGEWLLDRHGARPGDEVHVTADGGNRFLFRFVPSAAARAGAATAAPAASSVYSPARPEPSPSAIRETSAPGVHLPVHAGPVPDLLYRDHAGSWAPLPGWSRFFLGLGLGVACQPAGDARLVVAVAVPTRSHAAAFAATGVVIARTGLTREDASAEEHFARLLSLPRGTPVTLTERNRRLKGVLDGPEESGGVWRIRVRVMQNETRCLPAALAKNVAVTDEAVIRLPKLQTGRRITYRQEFLEGILRGISAHEFVARSRLECAIAGKSGALRDEITASAFAVRSSSRRIEQGTLQDVLRVKRFAVATEPYRTDVVTPEHLGHTTWPEGGPPVAVFDGAATFLKSRDRFPTSHCIVILDRTEPLFFDAVEQVRQDHAKRAGDGGLKPLPALPPGADLTAYTERPV